MSQGGGSAIKRFGAMASAGLLWRPRKHLLCFSALQAGGFGFQVDSMTPVPLLDLKRQYAPLREAIEARVREVMDSQGFILGPAVEAFEAAARAYCGAGHAVGMSSGTDAELAALMALEIGPGDAVITTPFTFFATAGCVARLGARAVFVDIDEDSFNLSPAALTDYLRNTATRDGAGILRTPTGERIRAVVPVHLFGQCCAMDQILPLAREFGLSVLEDASQALGAECFLPDENRVAQAGAMGEMGWFSFFPSKNLGAFGDAGMTTCQQEAHEKALRSLRMHGMEAQYFHRVVGGNFRLDALQAAVLDIKLPYLDGWSAARRANALAYQDAFTRAGLTEKIRLPQETHAPNPEGPTLRRPHIYHQYVIRVPGGSEARDHLRAHLGGRGIGSAIYYPLALHQQECFRSLGYQTGDFPAAEAAASEVVALPIFPELTRDERDAVVGAVADFFS
jgi:dTDP-4-amino-4,6-dideoxygalactose transaminase